LAKKKKKEEPERPSIIISNPSLPKVEHRFFARRHLLATGLIIACALVAYANTFGVPFHFDDHHTIVLNRDLHIKTLSLQAWLKFFDRDHLGSLRNFTNFTFAVNYYLGRLDPFVYHLSNLLIHMGAGLLFYGLLWLTLRLPVFRQSYGSIAFPVSLLSSLLFIVHPVQVQAVTYIVQRYSSLATLCFLLSMVCYVNARLSFGSRRWYWSGGAVVAGLLAFYSKENTLVLPLFIGLYEFLFFQEGTLKIERKTLRLILLFSGLLLLAILLFWGKFFLEAFHYRLGLTGLWSDRLLTQCRVFVFYIGLLIYPNPSRLNIDHDFPLSRSLLHPPATLPALLLVLGLLGLALWRVKKNPLLSFCIFWFYGNLLIESILPIDMVFEHRLYRSSASAFFLFSLCTMRGIEWFRQKQPEFPGVTYPYGFETVLALLLLLPLTVWTIQRNVTWRSTIALWEDAVRKSPKKPRPYHNLGVEFHRVKETEKAIASLTTSLKLVEGKSDYAPPHFSLGLIYAEIGQTAKAIDHFEKYYVIKPKEAKPLNEIGILYLKNKSFEKAISYFQRGIEIDPKEPKFYANLGNTYLQTNRIDEAIILLQKALSLDPELDDVHIKLAEAYEKSGQISLAREELRKTLSIQSDSSEAYVILGALYLKEGKLEEAIQTLLKGTQLNPQEAKAFNNLGIAYQRKGLYPEAIASLEKAVALDPGYVDALVNLGGAYGERGEVERAMASYQKALHLQPENAEAHNNLGKIYLDRGKIEEAQSEFRTALRINPQYADAYINIGIVHFKNGGLEAAISAWKKALEIEPRRAMAHNNLAIAYYRKNQTDLARSHLDQALRLGYPVDPRVRELIQAR
jgi:type IV pilus biogenesis/stability protein PilW